MLAGAPGQSWLGEGGWHASCSVPPLLVSEHSLAPPSTGPGAGELDGVASGARAPPRQVSVSPPALPPEPGLCAEPPEGFDGEGGGPGRGRLPLRAPLLLAWGRAGGSERLLPTPAVSPTSPGALFPSDESHGPEDLHQASGPSVLVQKEAGRADDGACGVTGGPWDLGRRPHPCGWPRKQGQGSSVGWGPS